MQLSETQKRHLRTLGHHLKPVIMVGTAGISEPLLKEFDSTIRHHELVKVKFPGSDREQRDRMIEDLCERGAALLVTRTGNTAILYRPNTDERKIRLPA